MTKKEREAYEKGYIEGHYEARNKAANLIDMNVEEIYNAVLSLRSLRPAQRKEGKACLSDYDEIVFEISHSDAQTLGYANSGVITDEYGPISSQLLAIVFGWADPVTPL